MLYTGTHDNATCNEDYHTYDSNKRISLRRFFKNQGYSSRSFNEMLCQYALDTDADTVILPIWDICGFKEEARINTPGTVSNKNWTWKLKDFKTFPDKLMSTKKSGSKSQIVKEKVNYRAEIINFCSFSIVKSKCRAIRHNREFLQFSVECRYN